MIRGSYYLTQANDIPLPDCWENWLALMICIVAGKHSEHAMKDMGIAPGADDIDPVSKKTRRLLNRGAVKRCKTAFYITRHICGLPANEIAKIFSVSAATVCNAINAERKEMNNEFRKTDNDRRGNGEQRKLVGS